MVSSTPVADYDATGLDVLELKHAAQWGSLQASASLRYIVNKRLDARIVERSYVRSHLQFSAKIHADRLGTGLAAEDAFFSAPRNCRSTAMQCPMHVWIACFYLEAHARTGWALY